MNQKRHELLTEHRKAESECSLLSNLPSYLTPAAPAIFTKPPSVSPLEEALKLTTGDRQKSYGHPLQDFTRTAGLWTALLGDKLNEAISPEEVALAMVCLKMSRQQNKHKQDNLIDMAGYVNCLDMLIKEKADA